MRTLGCWSRAAEGSPWRGTSRCRPHRRPSRAAGGRAGDCDKKIVSLWSVLHGMLTMAINELKIFS